MTLRAIFLTAFDRPDLLERTMRSWEEVRGVADWPFIVRVEPGPKQEECVQIAWDAFTRMGHQHCGVVVNPQCYGVLHHPWVGFENLFLTYDFVLRAEDDLCVSDDILEYFEWAEQEFRVDREVATIHGFEAGIGSDPGAVQLLELFNPWIWGTWVDRWRSVIRDTWDHDYSTYNGWPGHESGWDWNLNSRVFPAHGLVGVFPETSRVDNIGIFGIHGTAENFRTAASFRPHYDPTQYRWSVLKGA